MSTPVAAETGERGVRPDEIKAIPVRHPWRWVAIVVIAILAAMLVNNLLTNPNYRWDTVGAYLFRAPVLRGVGYTLLLTVLAMLIAVLLGVLLAVMRLSDNPVLSGVGWFYLWVFRGTPVYTQLVFWGLIGTLLPTIGLGIPFGPTFVEATTYDIVTPFMAAMLGLALNEAAYMAEIVRSGLLSVDYGQAEAAEALGMNRSLTMRRIVLPQAMRVIVPPTGNETISMLKTTSLVLAVPFILDLQFATNAIGSRLFQPLPLLIVAAIWYLAVTSILMVGQYYLERYYGRGSMRQLPKTPWQRARQLMAMAAGRGAGAPRGGGADEAGGPG